MATALCALGLAAPAEAAIFTVSKTGDASDFQLSDAPNSCDVSPAAGEQCTLRAAIEESNTTVAADSIEFAIPGGGVRTITPATTLPQLTDTVMINGYTQPGASPNGAAFGKPIDAELRIQLDGSASGQSSSVNGLTIGSGAGGSVIRGLVINRFATGVLLNDTATLAGNFIGTGPSGRADRGNSFDGVFGFSGNGTLIGGTTPAARNLISGNGRDGVSTNSPFTIQGNYIGTKADATSPLGNLGNGASMTSPGNQVGGPAGAANIIAFNGSDALTLFNASVGTTVSRNRIFDNGLTDPMPGPGLGIDLGADGVTANDPDDGDSGPNELQNFPRVLSATTSRRRTRIAAELNSTPSASFRIEFFSNHARQRQGERFIGAKQVTTDAQGDVSFSFKPGKKVPPGRKITVTATNSSGSTSEFSAPRKVTRP